MLLYEKNIVTLACYFYSLTIVIFFCEWLETPIIINLLIIFGIQLTEKYMMQLVKNKKLVIRVYDCLLIIIIISFINVHELIKLIFYDVTLFFVCFDLSNELYRNDYLLTLYDGGS